MRIFRSVFLHYSADPQSYRKLPEHVNICDLQCVYVTGPFARTEKVQWRNAMTLIRFSFGSKALILPHRVYWLCMSIIPCRPTLEHKLHKVGTFFLVTRACTSLRIILGT